MLELCCRFPDEEHSHSNTLRSHQSVRQMLWIILAATAVCGGAPWCSRCQFAPRLMACGVSEPHQPLPGGGGAVRSYVSKQLLNTQHCCCRTPTKTGFLVWCAPGLDRLICSWEGARAARGPCSDEALVLAVK